MHHMANFEAWRQHREENRLGRQLRAAKSKKNPLASLARGRARRASGAPQAAG